jgi:uncharacterized membrane protein
VTISRRPLWLPVALIASLALNLFVLARLATPLLLGPADPPPPEAMLPHLVEELAAALPAADAALLRQTFDGHAANIAGTSRAVAAAHEQVRAALAADPFDEAALAAALDQLRDAEQALHGAVRQTVLDIAPRLSPEARHALAAWVPNR